MRLTENFIELMQKPEDLHEDLQFYLHQGPLGQMVHHPLVIEMFYRPGFCALLNAQYVHKKAYARQLLKEKDYYSYTFLHERPYRLSALERCYDDGLRGKPYWKLIGNVWVDSDNIHQNLRAWRRLWAKGGEDRIHAMDEGERCLFTNLPSNLTVWRGTQYKGSVNSLSWTINQRKAEWFARRYLKKRQRPRLVTGSVQKDYIYAYFTGRNENEVVSNAVTVLQVEELK